MLVELSTLHPLEQQIPFDQPDVIRHLPISLICGGPHQSLYQILRTSFKALLKILHSQQHNILGVGTDRILSVLIPLSILLISPVLQQFSYQFLNDYKQGHPHRFSEQFCNEAYTTIVATTAFSNHIQHIELYCLFKFSFLVRPIDRGLKNMPTLQGSRV